MKSKEVLIAESIIASRRLTIRQEEIEKLVAELIIANKELLFQNEEKVKRAAELIIANKELAFQNEEKGKRAKELILANKKLAFQNEEKEKRAAELVIANKELAFQNEEKEKRAAELIIANKELLSQHEEKEKRAAELIIANNLNLGKDKFFSIIAHDLRSPFQFFLGLTQEMAEELPRLTKDEMQKIAAGMRDAATNLFHLVEDLLQWSIMRQGLMPFNPKVVQLLPIVNESIAMAQASAQNKEIKIACDIPDGMEVFVENNMLQTVIRNLVSNAVKFTLKGGEITLSAKNTADKSVEISVKDTGIGMSHKIVDNIFRIDVRTNRKGTDGEPSTGVGLLLCKEFVEKHGGKIRVESEEDKGSVFYFTIPCNPAPGKENLIKDVVTADEAETRIKPLKILIAEDDEISESLITIMVKKFGKEILKVKTLSSHNF